VITTIMLNDSALVATVPVGFGGPLQDKRFGAVTETTDIVASAKLAGLWG